jgi:hypothetical protein
MNIFDRFFIGAYQYFLLRSKSDAKFAAITSICAAMFLSFVMPLILIKIITRFDVFSVRHSINKIYILPIPIISVLILYLIYPAKKTDCLLQEFEKMKPGAKKFWQYSHILVNVFWCLFMLFLVYLNKAI